MTQRAFLLVLEYDGTDFCGWQRQKNDRTVQATIERALETMLGAPIRIAGSGRTDAGVHALAQTASFQCATTLEPDAIRNGLNSLLPADVVVHDCRETDAGFHARYRAVRKQYRYRILNRRLPAAIDRRTAWHIRRPLDLAAMNTAAGELVGTHDFKAFEAAGSPRSHAVRTVYAAGWHREGNSHLVFEIEADGFLRYMVRNMVGTLVEVGSGKRRPADVAAILSSRNRSHAGPTAPAHGLFLVRVVYE